MTKIQERLRNWLKVYPEDQDKPEGDLYLQAAEYIDALEHDAREGKDFIEELMRDVTKLSYTSGYAKGLLQSIVDWNEQREINPEWLPQVKRFLENDGRTTA